MRFPLTLPTNKPFDAVGFGLNAVDHLIVVPKYPSFDTKTRLLRTNFPLAVKRHGNGGPATARI
jgi:hypothetical protein